MMVMLMITHRRLLTVVVLMLILFGNCVISSQQQQQQQRNTNVDEQMQHQQQQQEKQLVQSATITAAAGIIKINDTINEQQTQQQQQQQQRQQENVEVQKDKLLTLAVLTKTPNAPTTDTTITPLSPSLLSSSLSSSSSSSSSSSLPASSSSSTRRKSNEFVRNGESGEIHNSAEILNESEDTAAHSSITPTTYRPQRASAPTVTSAQNRERQLMNVLAARRNALHRGGFRTRVGTTGRTAVSIETTSKSPTDPRSICIRNCTKNFTRRTTASCMRQCANFSRSPLPTNNNSTADATVIVRPSSKSGLNTQTAERDTNEILFTDESSHGLFVVAKDQNDTLNHIPDAMKSVVSTKFRSRGKPMQTVTLAPASIEEDDIQPYLYFGQKLPPIKPAMLTITAVSDEHPKLLEVSVAQFASTTPAPSVATSRRSSTLSPVERSRSRYKYGMRDRGSITFNRRFTSTVRPTAYMLSDNLPQMKLPIAVLESSTTDKSSEISAVKRDEGSLVEKQHEELREKIVPELALRNGPIETAQIYSSSTPLIITVLGEDDEATHASVSTTRSTTEKSATTTTTSTTSRPTTKASTSSSSTTTTTTPASTTLRTTKSTTAATTTLASSTTTTSTTTSTPSPKPKHKTIIDEDTERLRALGPILTQEFNTDDKPNLIIFINRTSNEATTASAPAVVHTTILTSIRSTVNPRSSSTSRPLSTTTTTTTTNNGRNPATIVGIIETSSSVEESTLQQPTVGGVNDISSTVVADEREVSAELRRMNIATMVLAGIGIIPLLAVVLYLVRNFMLRRQAKNNEDFDVCITDQQPISPVKKIDSKYHTAGAGDEEEDDEVDHHLHHHIHQQTTQSKTLTRDANHNHRYDEQCSVTSDQEFDRSNIRLKSLLGEGNFGQVWKAEADDLSGHFGATRIVAVKTIRACSAQVSLKDEANMMRKLGSHQNVVTLLGACVESEPHMLIMEYAMRGRLLSLLRAARNATNILPASVPGGRSLTPLSPRTLAGFALDIACGMEYIAEKRIVHRDLAARNVLLDHNGVCKICDFGMSLDLDAERKRKEQEKNCANDIMRSNSNKFKFDFGGRFIINHWSNNFTGNHSSQNNTTTPHKEASMEKKAHHGHDTISKRHALPIRWMAPEALQYHVFTTETDVWAFGIVLWEIATLGSTPYSQLTGREVIRRVPNGMRPDLPKEGRHEFYNLMARCWHKEPHLRPTFSQSRLEISRSLHKWVDDDSAASDYMDVSGFSEDLEHGMVYFNHRISEFECEI